MTPRSAFEELNRRRHDREAFSCGKAPLDTSLKTRALQHQQAGTSLTRVLPGAEAAEGDLTPVLAFYTVSVATVERDTLPEAIRKRLPFYPVPVFLIGQLAVDLRVAGQGFGGVTLVSALRYLCAVHQQMPAVAIVVDCLDAAAEAFYSHYGFQPLCEIHGRQRLFLPMKTALAL